jgi:hypothetical protein
MEKLTLLSIEVKESKWLEHSEQFKQSFTVSQKTRV